MPSDDNKRRKAWSAQRRERAHPSRIPAANAGNQAGSSAPPPPSAAAGNQVGSSAQPTPSAAAGNQVGLPAQPTQPQPSAAAGNQVGSSAPPPPPPPSAAAGNQVGLPAQPTQPTPSAAAGNQVGSSAPPPPPPPPSPAADADEPSDNKPVLTVEDPYFKIDGISLQAGGHAILTNSSLEFQKDRRYGLMGPSGSGKSTLLRAIGTNTIPIPENMSVYYLSDGVDESDLTAVEAIMGNNYKEEKRRIEKLIEDQPEENDNEELYRELDKIGPKAYHFVCDLLSEFGFNSYLLHKKTRDLSESWRMKIALAKAIYLKPPILLLKNPTKYLDFDACRWLEDKLRQLGNIQVIVSNSESFLQSVCTDFIEISVQDKIIVEHCDTDLYEYQRQKSQEIDESVTTSTSCDDKFSFTDVAGGIHTGGNMVHWSNVDCVHQHKTLFKDVSLDINYGSKIALVGGSGKSVLLKSLARTFLGLKGTRNYMCPIQIEIFEQNSVGMLDPENLGIHYMKSCNKGTSEQSLIAAANNFGLSEKMLNQKIKSLSDCQKTRLVFAAMAAKKPQLLLLDEPTTHVNYDAIGCLAEGLKKWDGAFIIAGHDFRLISLIAPEIWVCENQGITKTTCDITICRNEMIEEAADKRSVVRPPCTAGLFNLFSVGSYRNISMPFMSYLKYIDHQDNIFREPSISLERFKKRRYMTAFVPCNSFEEGFMMIPGEKAPGKPYEVSTDVGKIIASSFLEAQWELENVGLCLSDFSKENLFVTPSGQVKFRGVQLVKFSDDQMLRNLKSSIAVLKYLFERDGRTPKDMEYLLNLMNKHPEKREIFHSNASLVPLSNYGDCYMKLYGCLNDKIEPSLRESILEGLPHLDDFVQLVQGNELMKGHYDYNGGKKYITTAPALLPGQQSLTAEQEKKFKLERARKMSKYLRNRVSHRMELYGRTFRYLPDMADLAVLVRLPLVNCYLQEKLFDAGETKDLMLHNLIKKG